MDRAFCLSRCSIKYFTHETDRISFFSSAFPLSQVIANRDDIKIGVTINLRRGHLIITLLKKKKKTVKTCHVI